MFIHLTYPSEEEKIYILWCSEKMHIGGVAETRAENIRSNHCRTSNGVCTQGDRIFQKHL